MIESLGVSWIVLSWQSNIAVESYNVAVSGGGTEVNYTVNGTEVNLNVTGLRGNTEYSLRVIAIGTNGETSSPSATITAVTAIPGRDFSIPKIIFDTVLLLYACTTLLNSSTCTRRYCSG